MATTNIRSTTPQLNQLEIMFKAPLWADMQVGTPEDLQKIKHLYVNKLVWVNSEQTWYYYFTEEKDSTGKIFHRWEKQSSRSVINIYEPNKEYLKGDSVYCNGKIYTAQMSIKKNETPLVSYDPPKWMCISGNTITREFIFSNASAVVIETDIKNPIFVTYLKDKVTGLDRFVLPSYEKLSETEYRFEFYESGVLTPQSGSIIHK